MFSSWKILLIVSFNRKNHGDSTATSWVGSDGRVYHSHDGLAPHSHEPIYSPGYFSRRAPPILSRNFNERAFTVGIGGPVGTGYFTFSFKYLIWLFSFFIPPPPPQKKNWTFRCKMVLFTLSSHNIVWVTVADITFFQKNFFCACLEIDLMLLIC